MTNSVAMKTTNPIGLSAQSMKRNGLLLLLVVAWLGLSGATSQGNQAGKLVCVDGPQSDKPVCAYEFNPDAKQTVVLIHGLHGDPLKDWAGQIPLLSRDYHVLSLQLSSFYKFSEDAPEDGVTAITQALHKLIQHFARGRIVLLAHSMGGVIGLRYAIEYKESVKQLVLADVAGVLHRIAFTRSLVKNRKRTEGEGDLFTKLVEKLATKLLIGMDNFSAEIAALLRSQGDETDIIPDRPELLAAFQLIDVDFSRSISTLNLPVLIVWGENDRIAPLRTAYTLSSRLPSSQLLVIPQAGHLAMREKPEVFNHALEDFFSRSPSLQRTGAAYPERDEPLLQEVECHSENGRVFTGYYRRIALNGCDDAVIHDARVGEVVAIGSRLKIIQSNIGGGAFGLSVTGSDVEITASRIEGDIALLASRSRLDMAAVDVIGHKASVQGEHGSDLVFSLSTLNSPLRQGSVHGYFTVDSTNSL